MNVPLLTQAAKDLVVLPYQGIINYEVAWQMQREIHQEVVQGVRANTLLLLEHPSVFTAGRRTQDNERPKNGTPVIDVDRGGKITWHGPGQLVGYPIIKLANPTELVGFVRVLENALIKVCRDFGITAQCFAGRSGVWIRDEKGDRKISAIGIRVAQGVTMHGFALNISPDLKPFTQIIPCGIPDAVVTSMQFELSRDISIEEVAPVVEKYICQALAQVCL